jgi:hypothetical protein
MGDSIQAGQRGYRAILAIMTWVFVTFGDSGSRKQNCHERGEGGELENPY